MPRWDPSFELARIRWFVVRHPLPRFVLAAALGLAALRSVGRRADELDAERQRWGESVTVLRLRSDVPLGAPVTSSEVEPVVVPIELAPPDALRDLPAGSTARDPLGAGELLRAERIRTGATEHAETATIGLRLGSLPFRPEVGDRVLALPLADPFTAASEFSTGAADDPAGAIGTVVEVGLEDALVELPRARAIELASVAADDRVTLVLLDRRNGSTGQPSLLVPEG